MADTGQQHPISVYFLDLGAAFRLQRGVLHGGLRSAIQGYLRWTLIIIFMMLKAGFIVAIFMHMRWERVALITAVLVPPGALLVLVALMAMESDYTWLTRVVFFGEDPAPVPLPPPSH